MNMNMNMNMNTNMNTNTNERMNPVLANRRVSRRARNHIEMS